IGLSIMFSLCLRNRADELHLCDLLISGCSLCLQVAFSLSTYSLRWKKAFLRRFAVYVRAFGTLNYALWLSPIVVNLAIGRTTYHARRLAVLLRHRIVVDQGHVESLCLPGAAV